MNIDRFLQELQEDPKGCQFLGAQRLKLFREIHEIVFLGKGGYTFEAVYTLPVWLRHFIYSEILKYYREEAAAMDKNSNSQTLTKTPKGPAIKQPDISIKPRK